MMLFWLLLPILAGCLSLNPNEPDRGFLEACGQLSMVHEGSEMGVLSGQCDGRDVSLDLNDCIEYHGVTDLQPGTSGNLRQICRRCGIVGDGGHYRTTLPGHMECFCHPDPDEPMFLKRTYLNLVNIVTVDDHGSLQCNAPIMARTEVADVESTSVDSSWPRPCRGFVEACRDLKLHPQNGRLAGKCVVGKCEVGWPRPKLPFVKTTVDLTKCLAWGSSNGQEPSLYPAKNGNFTDNCNSCLFFNPVWGTGAPIQCQCAPKGSEARLAHIFDLDQILTVSDLGQLQCAGTTGTALMSPVLKDDESIVDSILSSDDPDGSDDRDPCEEQIEDGPNNGQLRPEFLPKRYEGTEFKACPNDPSMCCFYPEQEYGPYRMEGFKIIQGNQEYWYRLHYVYDRSKEEQDYHVLSAVYRLCTDPDMCPDGETSPPEQELIDHGSAREDTPCDQQIQIAMDSWPRILPHKQDNTQFQACPGDPSTCCFWPKGLGEENDLPMEGFKLVATSGKTYYRFHFNRDYFNPEEGYSHLQMVYRVCKWDTKDACPEEDTPGPFGPPTTKTTIPPKKTYTKTRRNKKTKSTSSQTGTTTTARASISTSSSQSKRPRLTPISSQAAAARETREVKVKQRTKVVTVTLPPNSRDTYPRSETRPGWVAAQDPTSPSTMVTASPINIGNVSNAGDNICLGFHKKAVCCTRLAFGRVATGCDDPNPSPHDTPEFVQSCYKIGKTALCCSLNLPMGFSFICRGSAGPPSNNLLSPRATVDGYDDDSLNFFALSPKSKSTKDVVIDLSKLDVGELIENILGATNIQDVHHAEIDLTVQAKCESKNGATGCSDLVIEMSGTPLLNVDLGPRPLEAKSIPSVTKTTSGTTKTKTKTKTKPASKTTKTRTKTEAKTKTKMKTTTKVITQTSTAPPKKTLTLTTTVGSNGTASSSWMRPTGMGYPKIAKTINTMSRLHPTRDLTDIAESTTEPTVVFSTVAYANAAPRPLWE